MDGEGGMSIDRYILGDSALYARLCIITAVLGRFVASTPRAVSLEQLEQQTGRPARELVKLCNLLCRENLLQAHAERPHTWLLACDASQVTLEDAFRCVVAEQAARARPGRQKNLPENADGVQREVDLLVMQATMGINQSVFQHLRQFSLDRLKVSAAGMFPARRARDPAAWGLAFS
jgi:DNA-binding IscR family transcriptional regulator